MTSSDSHVLGLMIAAFCVGAASCAAALLVGAEMVLRGGVPRCARCTRRSATGIHAQPGLWATQELCDACELTVRGGR